VAKDREQGETEPGRGGNGCWTSLVPEAPHTTIKPFAFSPFFMHSIFPTHCRKTTPSLSNNLLKTYLVAKLMELEMEV
jgi:hypothetical protein